jgi:4-hydroxy-2-oxoheptanedioate aldolase
MAYANPFLGALAAGRPSIGSWVSTAEPVWAEVIARTGYDHVLVDLQHGSTEVSTLAPVLQAIEVGGSAGIVRVPVNDATTIGKVLDLGALAVVVPLVESAAEAAAAVAACRYPPAGRRSAGPLRPNLVMGSDEPSDWARVGCVVMVETAAGLANVDEIAAVDGLTGIYVGPGDLAISIGMSPYAGAWSAAESARHADAVETIRAACDRNSIAAGIYVGDGERARTYLAQGFRIVTASIDYTLIDAGSRRDLDLARGRDPGGLGR